MQIPKAIVVEKIRSEVGNEAAERADAELPEKVSPVDDAQLLKGLGIDPEQLREDFRGQSPVAG